MFKVAILTSTMLAGVFVPAVVHAQAAAPPAGIVDLRRELLSQTEADVIARFGTERLSRQGELAAGEPATDFHRLLATAVRRHPSIRAVIAQRVDADEGVAGARAALYPQVSLGFNTSKQISNRNSENLLTPRRSLTYIDGGVDVSQLLFDSGATFRRIDAAKDRSRASLHQAESSIDTFALEAVRAYLDIVRYRAQIILANENVSRHKSVMNYVLERVQAGAGSKADQLRVESRLSDARSQLISLTAGLDQAIARYREVFKEEPEEPVLPSVRPALPKDADTAVAQAKEANPDYKRGQALTEAARNEYRAALNDRWPRLSAHVSGTQYDVLRGSNQPRLFDVTGQVRVAYNFFTGGAETAQRRQVAARLDQAMFEEQNFALELERAVRMAASDIEARAERLRSDELASAAGAATIEAFAEQFTVGRRGLTELLDAQRDHEASLLGMIDSRIELEVARYRLLALTGGMAPLLGVADLSKAQSATAGLP